MAKRRSRFTEAEICRAVRAMTKAGYEVNEVHIDEFGKIIIRSSGTNHHEVNPWDVELE